MPIPNVKIFILCRQMEKLKKQIKSVRNADFQNYKDYQKENVHGNSVSIPNAQQMQSG